jgi:hypothetical protein
LYAKALVNGYIILSLKRHSTGRYAETRGLDSDMKHEAEIKRSVDGAKVDVATEVLEQLVSEGKASRVVRPNGEVVYQVHWDAAVEDDG